MNKVVLVTGGSRGIGKAICEKFAKNGYDVIVNCKISIGRAIKLCDYLQKNYHICALYCQADISKHSDVVKLFDFVLKKFKRIDVLVNNAGISINLGLSDRTIEHFYKTFETNVFGTFDLCKLIGQFMFKNKHGKIINISSDNSILSNDPVLIDYDASKAAINLITKDLAKEFAPFVNVNAVAPGWIETDMDKDILTEDVIELEKQRILKNRIGKPEDVANLVYFLASDESDYINGEIIVINGGKK